MGKFSETLTRAFVWQGWGADLIPKQPKAKDNIAGFGSRQKRIKTMPEAEAWFGGRSCNLSIALDNGIVGADFDVAEVYWKWAAGPGANVRTYAELTARGAHVIWRGDALPSGNGPGVEFKNSGVLMVAPSVHPSGVTYRILCDLPPARLTLDQAQTLFPFLSSSPKNISTDIPKVNRALSNTPSIVEVIKSKVAVVDELNAAGVKAWRAGGSGLVACCPFHADHNPSLWAMPERGVWGCSSPKCKAFGKHDAINARALRRGTICVSPASRTYVSP